MRRILGGLSRAFTRYANLDFEAAPGETIILDASGSRGSIGARSGRLVLTDVQLVFKPVRKKPVTIPPLKNTFLSLDQVVSVEMQAPSRLFPWVRSFTVQPRDAKKLVFRTRQPERWVQEINVLLSTKRGGWASVWKEPPG